MTALASARPGTGWQMHRLGGWPEPMIKWRVAWTPDDLAGLATWMGAHAGELLGIDCETNGYAPQQHAFRVRTVQIASLTEAWVVPVWDMDYLYTCGHVLARLIHDHPRFVAWFAENEVQFLTRDPSLHGAVRLGDREPHIADGQPLLGLYDPRTVTTHNPKDRIDPRIPLPQGLKETNTRLLTPELQRAEDALHARFAELAPVGHRQGVSKIITWGFRHVDLRDPAYLLYGALDPIAALRVATWLKEMMPARRRGRARAALTEQWMVDQATAAGMLVDGPYAEWLDRQLEQEAADLADALDDDGVPPSGQGPAVAKAFRALGVAGRATREGGESYDAARLAEVLATAEGLLKALAQVDHLPATPGLDRGHVERIYRLASNVLGARKVTKYRSTWVTPMLRTVREADGAMHGRMRAIGTVTDRMTYRKTFTAGPMHSAPKRATTLLRAAVRARRGHVLVSADFSQAEPFVMAARSGDTQFLADLESGDINSVTATLVFGDAYDRSQGKTAGTPSYQMRQTAKIGFLSACYGASPAKVAAVFGLPESEGGRIRQSWRDRWPRLWSYNDELNRRPAVELDSGAVVPLWDRYFVNSETGQLQLRTWEDGTPKPSRLGLNADTQGTQADILKVSMHRLNHAGWSWALRFFMHDEIVGEVPEPFAEAFRNALTEAMTVTYRGVTIRCEATIEGRTWAPQPAEFDAAALPAVDEEEL